MKRVKKRKGIKALRVKHPTPSREIDALIGEEEQNGKEKRTKRNPATLDHSVAFYDPQGSYWEPFLFTPLRPTVALIYY